MENKFTRENLVENYSKYEAELKALKAKKYDYKTNRPYMPFGKASQMSYMNLVDAYVEIHSVQRDRTAAVEVLGIDVVKHGVNVSKILGFTAEEWDHDLKLRVEELNDEERMETLEKALATFKQFFSDDNKFAMAMAELASTL